MTKPPPTTKSPATPSTPPSLVSASLSGAKFLILLQIFSRLLTFIVNQILLRYLSPTLLGISVQLDLLNSSILYFSRESLRNALQRQPSTSSQPIINLSLLTIPLGLIFSLILSTSYTRTSDVSVLELPYFNLSVSLYILATLLELLSEPAFSIVQQKMLYKIRATAESTASGARVFVTCGATIWAARNGVALGPLGFALGQTAYAGVLLVVYLWKIGRAEREFSMVPRKVGGAKTNAYAGLWERELSWLALTMWFQAAIKHVLTTGDALLIATLSTPHAQGIYAVSSNYGSIIARLLFQPVEEAARNLFAKIEVEQALPLLQTVVKLYLLFSSLVVALGPPFAGTALAIVAGKRWADGDAGATLGVYCYYLPLLAINGVLEAFVQSVASPAELGAQSAWMVGFSVIFAVVGYIVLGFGASGLVLANALNMLLRIIWAGIFVRGKNTEKTPGWSRVLPDAAVVGAAVAAGAVARSSVVREAGMVREIATAAGLGVGLLAVVAVVEREFFVGVWRMARERR